MVTAPRRWLIAKRAPDNFPAQFPNLPPLVAQILYNRGLIRPDEVRAFLEGSCGPAAPLNLLGMTRAVERIRQALERGEPIVVYGDFDADGVTATALLVQTLRALGGEVQPYIPHRVREGYGLHLEALKELAQEGVQLVITVDCGIRFPDEISYAQQQGMDVIVTDHHIVGQEELDAVAVVNPHQPECSYSYKELAGVGLAYKLAQALLRANRESAASVQTNLQEEELLDLVALGTVADMAPLTGENRLLVIGGLKRLNSEPRPGIAALMRQAGIHPGKVNAEAIGYGLGPRLNAAGRVGHAKTAYQLLTTQYPAEAERLAEELDNLNRERQQLTHEIQERAREYVRAEEPEAPLIFLADPEFKAGIVGLVASRLMEEFYRPAIVVEERKSESRGSARSIPEFHITRALDACAELLIQHGGHAAAAGFVTRTADLPQLKERLWALATDELEGKQLAPTLYIDAETPLQEMSWSLWRALQQLEPFGEENAEPVFVSRNVSVRHCRAVGNDSAHLKVLLHDGKSMWDGIAFRQGDWADHLPDRVDVAYHLQLNEWRGEQRLQLNIQDIRPAG